MSHGNCGGCCHECGNVDELEMGVQYSLYKMIDTENLECLNEEVNGSGATIFKAYEDRFDRDKFVVSDSDEELLFNIPFTGNIRLKNIRVAGADDNTHPKLVKIYKNRPKMSFDDTSVKCDQEIQLSKDATGDIEYTVKVPIFSGVYHLSLYFPANYGESNTKIYYIGLRGEYSAAHRHGVTICNYELKPNIQDHKGTVDTPSNFIIN